MIQYSILRETESGCILQESFVSAYDAENELGWWRSADPARIYFIEEHEAEEPEGTGSGYEPASIDAPLFYGRYVGETFESLAPGTTVAVYPLEAWERERPDASDFKILVHETGEGFFYASADEVEVFTDDVLVP